MWTGIGTSAPGAETMSVSRGEKLGLLALLLVRAGAGAWFVPNSDKVRPKGDGYEKARGTRSSVARVGPNRFVPRGTARNDRDGSIRQEDGKGVPLAQPSSVLETSMTRERHPGWISPISGSGSTVPPSARNCCTM